MKKAIKVHNDSSSQIKNPDDNGSMKHISSPIKSALLKIAFEAPTQEGVNVRLELLRSQGFIEASEQIKLMQKAHYAFQ